MADADQPFKEDKTEPPSAKKKGKARKDGNIPQSIEINSAIVLLSTVIFFRITGPWFMGKIGAIMKICFHDINMDEFTVASLTAYAAFIIKQMSILCMPAFFMIMSIAFLCNYIQVGPLFTLKPLAPKFSSLKPKFSSLNPFKFEQITKTGISFLKLLAVSFVVYTTIKKKMYSFVPLIDMSIRQIFSFATDLCFWIVVKTSMLLLLISFLDYAKTYYKWYTDMKMTKQEKKDEAKEGEMDPKIKNAIRQRGREILVQAIMRNIPKADVVITNPTHIAVAVEYAPDSMNAPVVVAKGQRLMAERIKDIAREHDIPIVENKPLARTLFKLVGIGEAVPEELYHAIAEVLSYVYKMGGGLSKKLAR